MNGMNEKHKNHMSKSNNSFSEAAGEKQQDLTMIQKTNADEDCNFADILSKVIMLEKQARTERTWAKTKKGWTWDSWTAGAKTSSTKTANSRTNGKTDWGRFSRKPATSSSDATWASFTYTDYFCASEDTIVWVKSLLMERRLEKFRDTKSLISRFNIRALPLLLENSLNFWKQDKTSVMTYC